MGRPMAGHLVSAGHEVVVWNRTPGKAEGLGASVAQSLGDLASRCDTVMLCVNRTEDVRECLAGLVSEAKPGLLFVDHSTIEPTAACDIEAELSTNGFGFVDAPITGGSAGAQNGKLTIFMGGKQELVDRAKPIVAAYAKRAERVGGPGQGQMMKMANQIAVAGALVGLCECLSFAKKARLDPNQARDLIGGGAAGSWAFENYGPKILQQDWTPGFSVKNQRKDFGYCKDAAGAVNAAIPATELVDGLLAALEREGHGEWATAALYEVLLEMSPR
jgi:3-hydroxyisobutyrate dehydrogenase-like beta-hydroxyacid dehydrogenase